jgi:hypothetical protein
MCCVGEVARKIYARQEVLGSNPAGHNFLSVNRSGLLQPGLKGG